MDQKRPERAVDLLTEIADREPVAHLVVVGSGPLAAAVRRRAEAAGVADRVHMLGHRDDVAEILAGLDVLVVTSSDEGVPGVVIEAAMAGCPVVTYRLGGVSDVVLDGLTGRVVDGEDVQAMAAAVSAVLDDPASRRRMSDAARDHSRNFSMSEIACRYESHLLELFETDSVNDHVR